MFHLSVDTNSDEITKQLLNCNMQTSDPLVVFLDTKNETILHSTYTFVVSKMYEIILSTNQTNYQQKVIVIPTKKLTPQYHFVAIGGTFDHLHCGHISLLQSALFSCSGKLYIGVSGDELLVNKKLKNKLQTYEERVQIIQSFISLISKYTTVPSYTIEKLHDANGITVVDPMVDALVLSPETQAGGVKINEQRISKGWQPLSFIVVDLIMSGESKVSSTTIRSN
ncbi:Phosphopantetheine adenylyltransferase [Entamoeba marina]